MLPGVTVTLTGIGAPQVFVTDSQGAFRFLNLSPGTYQVAAELAGFGKAVRNNVHVNVGQNADVELAMVPSAEATITVTAEAPLIDTRKTGTGAVVSKVELEQIPSGRDPWVIMGQAPGVQLDRVNVGGSESGQQDVIVAKGASDAQKTFNLDGVNITDVGALGSTPTYYDFDSFEEIQVTTGGSDPRIQTPGAQLNMVTKRGTNDYKGSARYVYDSHSWQASPAANGEAKSYTVNPILNGNRINTIGNYAGDIGGPIWRDKLWFWGSYARQDIKLFILQPVGANPTRDNTILKDWNAKVNAQFFPNNSLTGLYTYGNKLKFGRGASATHVEPATTLDQSGPTHMYKIEDTHIFNQSLYLTGLYSHILSPFTFVPEGGNVQPYVDADGVWHRSYYYYSTRRPQDSYRLDGSYFLHSGKLDHELKYGFGYRKAPVTSSSIYPATGAYGNASQGNAGAGDTTCMDATGSDCTGVALLTRPGSVNYTVKYNDLYLGDTLTMGSLTVQAGLRSDRQSSRHAPVTSGANPLAPDVLKAVSYPGDPQSLKWNSISPRIGFTYSLGAQKRTLVRGSYNQYVDQLGNGNLVAGGNPFLYANGVYYYWKDTNKDTVVQKSEILFNLGPYGGYYLGDIEHPNDVGSAQRIDYGMKVPRTHELIAGFETAIMPDFSVGADYTYRRLNDYWWIAHEKTLGKGDYYTPADYVLVGNITGTLPNGKTYSAPNYALKVPFSGLAVVTTRPNYHQTFSGLDLYATKRLTNKWMMRANFSLNDRKQHVGDGAFDDPTHVLQTINNQYGCTSCDNSIAVDKSYGTHTNTYINAKWQYNLTGLYQLPWQMSVSANLTGRQGYPIPYYVRINNHDGLGSKNVIVSGVDAQRLPQLRELDLRLAKDIAFGPTTTTLAIEGFNITDERIVLQRNPRLNQTTGNHITEFQSPRIFRVSAKLAF